MIMDAGKVKEKVVPDGLKTSTRRLFPAPQSGKLLIFEEKIGKLGGGANFVI